MAISISKPEIFYPTRTRSKPEKYPKVNIQIRSNGFRIGFGYTRNPKFFGYPKFDTRNPVILTNLIAGYNKGNQTKTTTKIAKDLVLLQRKIHTENGEETLKKLDLHRSRSIIYTHTIPTHNLFPPPPIYTNKIGTSIAINKSQKRRTLKNRNRSLIIKNRTKINSPQNFDFRDLIIWIYVWVIDFEDQTT